MMSHGAVQPLAAASLGRLPLKLGSAGLEAMMSHGAVQPLDAASLGGLPLLKLDSARPEEDVSRRPRWSDLKGREEEETDMATMEEEADATPEEHIGKRWLFYRSPMDLSPRPSWSDFEDEEKEAVTSHGAVQPLAAASLGGLPLLRLNRAGLEEDDSTSPSWPDFEDEETEAMTSHGAVQPFALASLLEAPAMTQDVSRRPRRSDLKAGEKEETDTATTEHTGKQSKPCLFYRSPVGCRNGEACTFCHLQDGWSSKRQWCKAKRNRFYNIVTAQISSRDAAGCEGLARGKAV